MTHPGAHAMVLDSTSRKDDRVCLNYFSIPTPGRCPFLGPERRTGVGAVYQLAARNFAKHHAVTPAQGANQNVRGVKDSGFGCGSVVHATMYPPSDDASGPPPDRWCGGATVE